MGNFYWKWGGTQEWEVGFVMMRYGEFLKSLYMVGQTDTPIKIYIYTTCYVITAATFIKLKVIDIN